jgi:hypothetical protein
MTKMSIPNKTGDYEIDGVSIIILPDKIIVDTGARQTTTQSRGRITGTYPKKKTASAQSEKKKKDEKEPSLFSTLMENARDFALHGENMK